MKETVKDIGTHARATAMDGLLSVANFFGAGPAAEGLIRRIFGKKQLPSSAEIESIITKIVSNAKVKSDAEIMKLQNKLNDIPLVKSSLQKEAIQKYTNELRQQIAKKTANAGLADDLANSAMSAASSISYATASERKNLAEEATKRAEEAKKIYESNLKPELVENKI